MTTFDQRQPQNRTREAIGDGMRLHEEPRGHAAFSVRDLHVEFRTSSGVARAVNGISFDVAAGECLAIVGESGSGKSASLLAAMRLLNIPAARVTHGSAQVAGRELMSLSESELQDVLGSQIAMVFQDSLSSLNPVLTVGRQLSEAVRRHSRASRKDARRAAIEMLDRVGVPDAEHRYHQYPHELSGGMRQRAMIAMALIAGPSVLVADEPTTALDVTVQAQILDLVRSLPDMAVVWVTHDLGVVAGLADRVAVMYAGRIVEQGDVFDLFAAPRHPYTIALLASVPRMLDDARAPLASIPGLPPNMMHPPSGCAFYDRCPVRVDRCRTDQPELDESSPGVTQAACWVAQGVAGGSK
jgi:oligopeptide/dipeptide ABC transporter ATP-binding protein